MKPLDIYSEMAKNKAINYTILAGRNIFQSESEAKIALDIKAKLGSGSELSLLEIGCGPGSILLHSMMSDYQELYGLDADEIINVLIDRDLNGVVNTISGDWLEIAHKKTHDHILIYSVLHYMENRDQLFRFVDKALNHLASGGKLLLGDIPSIGQKKFFEQQSDYPEINAAYQSQVQNADNYAPPVFNSSALLTFSDKLILEIIERYSNNITRAYLLPQADDLPFNRTRVDILITK
jgi:2-polyprenyl-3-methyl-5-hydroxy-6-metoxy-1,4-benzoquinol methylase